MSDVPPPEEHAQPPVPASVTAVSVKIPPFWPADLLVWFAQVEAQFATHNITSQRTRFDHVVAALSNKFATEVRPQLDAPTCIIVDASDRAVEAVLEQRIASVRCPIAYFSRKLRPAERKYSTFDKELLAAYLAIRHF